MARESIQLQTAINARNAGECLTRRQFRLLTKHGVNPLGPTDGEHSNEEGWQRWRQRTAKINKRNYPYASERRYAG
jgi:hypothetical protein